jgi:hypothetical protein
MRWSALLGTVEQEKSARIDLDGKNRIPPANMIGWSERVIGCGENQRDRQSLRLTRWENATRSLVEQRKTAQGL